MPNPETGATSPQLTRPEEIRQAVAAVVRATPAFDMHTHLFPPQFGDLFEWGIDSLLTYHYLLAELFRHDSVSPARFWELPRSAQADLVWHTLFVRGTPISEATLGVVTILSALGLDPAARDLRQAREFFARSHPADHLERILDLASVSALVMTNDPFDPAETRLWKQGVSLPRRFRAALRLDLLLNDWPAALAVIRTEGHRVGDDREAATLAAVRQFVDEWIDRTDPVYLAVSLPDTFAWSEECHRVRLLRSVILPACRDRRLPLAMMIGVRRGVNPALRGAGDSVGRADVQAVEQMCRQHADNRFLVTMLSRENQHELCVAARKFGNLMPFGCWWFLNVPSLVTEITRQRLELLGATFVAQHSDARVLEQLIYKWGHARRDVSVALAEQYVRMSEAGRSVTESEMRRDASRLLEENFMRFAQPVEEAGSR